MIRTRTEIILEVRSYIWVYDPDNHWIEGETVQVPDSRQAWTRLALCQKLYDNLVAPDGTMRCRDIYFWKAGLVPIGWGLLTGRRQRLAGGEYPDAFAIAEALT